MSKILNGREFLKELLNHEVELSDFEVKHASRTRWSTVTYGLTAHDILSGDFKFRRKTETRVINGFTVPAPLSSMKNGDKYYVASVTSMEWSIQFPLEYCADENDTIWLSRGLCFETEEAAIANAKAMCGISPEE